MTLAYVVLAHRDPSHLARLGRALLGRPVVLHVDARVGYQDAAQLYDAMPQAVRAPRLATSWASWNLVRAAIDSAHVALTRWPEVSHVALLSGQDYLLRPAAAIDEMISRYPGSSAQVANPLPAEYLGLGSGMKRVRQWHQPIRRRRFRLPFDRRLPEGVEPHHGDQWWVLCRADLGRIASIERRRPDIPRFFRHVWIPDELYVPSVLCLEGGFQRMWSDSMWFTRWDDQGAHPHTMQEADLPDLVAAAAGSGAGKLFARKFDSTASGALLDHLDQRLGILET